MRNKEGVVLIEVILALTLFVVLLSGIGQLLSLALSGINIGQTRLTALYVGSEQMEAIKLIRDSSGINFEPYPLGEMFLTGNGEYYQPSLVNQNWVLGAKKTSQPPVSMTGNFSKYTRWVTIESVHRLVAGFACKGEIVENDINSCEDSKTRMVTVFVSWNEQGVPKQYEFKSLITDI